MTTKLESAAGLLRSARSLLKDQGFHRGADEVGWVIASVEYEQARRDRRAERDATERKSLELKAISARARGDFAAEREALDGLILADLKAAEGAS